MFKKIYIILILFVVLLTLTGCKNVFKTETPSIEEKVNTEIEYLESGIISILNSLNNIIYTNYKVIPTEVQQSDTASNPNSKMNESGETQNSEQKESLGTSGESGQSEEQGTGGKSSKKQSETLKMEPSTILTLSKPTIEWEKTKSDIEILYTAWVTASIDMKEVGVSEENIDKFNTELNKTIIAIKNEDKIKTMDGLTNMYSLLYEFINSYCEDRYKVTTIEIKKYTLLAYNYIENSKWDEAKEQLVQAEHKFDSIDNFEKVDKEKYVDIKIVKVLLKEMKNSLEFKDKQIALLKYKNLIQELTIL